MKKVKLGEIGKIVTGCTPSTKKSEYYESNDYMFVGPSDIKNVMYVVSSEKHISQKAYEDHKTRFINGDSIVVDCIGSDMGNVAIVKEDCLTNQQINAITNIDENNYNIRYVYYVLSTMKNYFHLIGTNGSTMPILNKSMFENIEIEVPDIEIQNKIANILSKLDDKIKLNNEINNNLYELAIKYLNEMQSDEEVTLSKFGKIQGGYAFKSKDLLDTKTNNRIIKIKNLRNEISADVINSQFVENEVIDKLDNKFKIKKGNVAIAMTGAELGKTGFIYGFDDYYLNQRVGLVRGITKEKELYLNILLLSQEFQDLLNSKGYGSAQPNVSTADIENITIQNIEDDDLMKFYEKVSPIYKKIILNCEENLNLEQLRNTLLPKLMNGEIDLYNIEI